MSHRQSTAQGIAFALYHELVSLKEDVFLDIRAEFDLHDLEKIVSMSKYFVFILSKDFWISDYCYQGNENSHQKIIKRAFHCCQAKKTNYSN